MNESINPQPPHGKFTVIQREITQVDEWAEAKISTGIGRRRHVQLNKCLEGDIWELGFVHRAKGRGVRLCKSKLVQPSADRIAPACPHFDTCGGCQWQHVSAATLLDRKVKLVKKCLCDVANDGVQWHEPMASPEVWHYRNKMEYSFGHSFSLELALGLHTGRRYVTHVQQCPIAPTWFTSSLARVYAWWKTTNLQAYHHISNSGSLRTLMLRDAKQGHGRMAVLTVSGQSEYALTAEQIQGFKSAMLSSLEDGYDPANLAIFITLQQCIPGQPTRFFEWHLHGPDVIVEKLHIDHTGIDGSSSTQTLDFTISPSTFFQPNTLAAQTLYTKAMQMLAPRSDSFVWDLFCGSGTLSILASRFAGRVIGVDLNPMAVLDAQANATRNGAENVVFECGDLHASVKTVINQLLKNGKPDAILIDPPRAGILEAGSHLLGDIAAAKIVYISCNPHSMATDIARLQLAGYRLKEVAIIDQFPQTGHIETIGLLTHASHL